MDAFLEEVAAAIRAMPPEQQAEVERLAKHPDTKTLIYLISRKFPYMIISKMTLEQRLSIGATVADILGEAEIWATVTAIEPLVLSKPE